MSFVLFLRNIVKNRPIGQGRDERSITPPCSAISPSISFHMKIIILRTPQNKFTELFANMPWG